MVCALTVRKLKEGAYGDFRETFTGPESPPPGMKAFYTLRNVDDENEVITFGLFDGTAEELRAEQQGRGYEDRMKEIESFVDSVGTSGMFEVVEERHLG